MVSDQDVRNSLYSLAGVLLLGLGLTYAIGAVVVLTGIHDKRERLPREGAEVTATVVSWDHRRGPRTRSVKLSYLYEGREYRPEIRCGCGSAGPAATMRLRVDPRRPTEFVAENNHTDDSRSVFNGVGAIPVGLFIAGLGGVLTWVGVASLREDRRATQKLKRYRARKAQPR
jgi:hypothetical protein